MVLADDPRDERGPGRAVTDAAAPSTATSSTMTTTECTRTSGTVHATSMRPAHHEQASRVVGVDQAAHRAREEEQGDDAGGEQQADLVRLGAVGLQAEGQGDQRHLVAERRDHPSCEGDDQVPASSADVQHMLNSIC